MTALAQRAAAPRPRVGTWRTVLACEWKLVRTDAGVWLATLLMAACVGYALFSGQQRLTEQAESVAAAQQDESQRRDALLRQAIRIERGEAAAPAESFRDPGNPLSVGRGSGASVVQLAPAPLAATAVGVSDLYPPTFRVAAGSRDRFLFVDEIANPTLLASGSFDLAFVSVVLLPLVLLALAYNVLSGEREQGTWALTLASSAPPLPVLAAKLLVRSAGVLGVFVGGTVLVLALQGAPLASVDAALALAAWSGLVLLYAAFWLALALWVNSWGRDSAFNAVALVLAWVMLVLVTPAGIQAVVEAWHPAPARSEMVLAVRQAAVDADRDLAAERARFRSEHGLAQPADAAAPALSAVSVVSAAPTVSAVPAVPAVAAVPAAMVAATVATATRDRRTLVLLLAADRRADDVLARHDAMVRANRSLVERASWLAPPVLLNDALAALAGNGPDRWDAHLANVSAFHRRWQTFFVERAERSARLASAEHALFPRFDAARVDTWVGGVAWRVAGAGGSLLVLAGVLTALAGRRLQRV